jgi:hypothetical protein
MKTEAASVNIEFGLGRWIVSVHEDGVTTERKFTTENAAKIWAFAQRTRLMDAGKLDAGNIQ